MGLSAGINLFAYVSGNPLSHVDALGLITNAQINACFGDTTCQKLLQQYIGFGVGNEDQIIQNFLLTPPPPPAPPILLAQNSSAMTQFANPSFAMCLIRTSELQKFTEQCQDECPDTIDGTIKFLSKYKSSMYGQAILKCTCQKAGGGLCQAAIQSCAKSTFGKLPSMDDLKYLYDRLTK